jgi:hypothetical protein
MASCLDLWKFSIAAPMKPADIDELLSGTKNVAKKKLKETLKRYEEYWRNEVLVAKDIRNILLYLRSKREKTRIPSAGCYTLSI